MLYIESMSDYVKQFFALSALFLFLFIALVISFFGLFDREQNDEEPNSEEVVVEEQLEPANDVPAPAGTPLSITVENADETGVILSETTTLEPRRVIIEAVGIDVGINNPASTAIADLDESLLSGAVRYPLSSYMEQTGNVFIFGHSSGLPFVRNESFKAFNGLRNVDPGDTVIIQTDTTEYLYKVESLKLEKDSNIKIALKGDRKLLTLSTCNTFGASEDRYVAEAYFVASYPIIE